MPIDTARIICLAFETPDQPWLRKKAEPALLTDGRHYEQKDYPTLLCSFAFLHRDASARLIILARGRSALRLK